MHIAVFDTYATRPDGRVMHFDILVPEADKHTDRVLELGRAYLAAKGVPADALRAEECRFCHMEYASGPIVQAVEDDGFAIVELRNCD